MALKRFKKAKTGMAEPTHYMYWLGKLHGAIIASGGNANKDKAIGALNAEFQRLEAKVDSLKKELKAATKKGKAKGA